MKEKSGAKTFEFHNFCVDKNLINFSVVKRLCLNSYFIRKNTEILIGNNKMSEQQKDLRKLCILNAKETETDDDIRNVCEEFGQLIGFNRPPNNKRLAFPLFNSLRYVSNGKICNLSSQ